MGDAPSQTIDFNLHDDARRTRLSDATQQPFLARSNNSFSLSGLTMPWPVETGEKPNIW
jgi:hypothetical protein